MECQTNACGRLRDECFSQHWFASFGHMRSVIDTRREDHNEQRPHSALGYQPPANFAAALLAAQQTTGRTELSSNISSQGSKEPLNKSSVERVAGKIGMIPRRTPQVVAWSTRPRRATQGAPDFAATLRDGSFAGGLRCQARSEGDRPFASSPFVHPIPQSCRRARVVLVQRLLS